jgi:PKHD-type hydroxylase
MFKVIPDLLTPAQISAVVAIAAKSNFVDGRISNAHNKAKNNLQTYDAQAMDLLAKALMAHEDFRNFCFPVQMTPPILARYEPGMEYGWHSDAAMIDPGTGPVRADLSCTIFLSDPNAYSGGALTIRLFDAELKFRGAAGSAIIYPSNTFHRVDRVTAGSRLVGLVFIQSRVAVTHRREMLYELNEVAALEGLNMSVENYARLGLVQRNLLNEWGDPPR